MRTALLVPAAALALAMAPMAALAMPLAPETPGVRPVPVSCPPGLAKKDPPCVPPGLARRGGYGVGDRYDGTLDPIDRGRYGLPPLRDGEAYVRVGDSILRLDREERIILSIVDLVLN